MRNNFFKILLYYEDFYKESRTSRKSSETDRKIKREKIKQGKSM